MELEADDETEGDSGILPLRMVAKKGGAGGSGGRGSLSPRALEHVFTASSPRSVMSLWSYSPSPMRYNILRACVL